MWLPSEIWSIWTGGGVGVNIKKTKKNTNAWHSTMKSKDIEWMYFRYMCNFSWETQEPSNQICSYPSLLILRVSSSHRLLVSTKMMVLFSFSLMISSSKRISLMEEGKNNYCNVVFNERENI